MTEELKILFRIYRKLKQDEPDLESIESELHNFIFSNHQAAFVRDSDPLLKEQLKQYPLYLHAE